MEDNIRKIEVKIAPKNKAQSAVSISIIADYLRALQNMMYIAGDYLEGNKYRTGGNFPNSIKVRCDLVITGLHYSSFEATVGLADQQTSLPFPDFPDPGTIGERALKLTKEIVDISAEKEDIAPQVFEIIPDEFRVHRCLQELESIWPDEKSQYVLNIGFNNHRVELNPKQKPVLQQAIKKTPEKYQGKLTGRLVEFRADRKRQCILDTPEGEVICKFGPELQDFIFQNMTKLITISGIVEQKQNKIFVEFDDRSALQTANSLTLLEVDFGEGSIKKLAYPLEIHADYEDETDSYIVLNDEFNLLAVASNLKEGMEEINEELKVLYTEYVKEDVSNLTNSAVTLRNKLLKIFGEEF
ncbi:MAG: hypothetical protein PWR16_367 [Methanoculleus sp.]|uniref:hypothetical protein n=1 Tax=unclassified Methanoculleus TaxID=2619537 RepID=UPI0025D98DE6|nr:MULTISPECIES: hypothetical protein [unclassified Methanoculleus]MDK2988838.1 hypothetical protein [Methanoculleus sp.]